MKIKLISLLIICFSFCFINMANAAYWMDDNFSQAGMDTSKWEAQGAAGPETVLEERGDGTLSWYTTGTVSSHTEKQYFSTWAFNAGNDFQFQVDAYYGHTGGSRSSLLMGIASNQTAQGINVFAAAEGNSTSGITNYHALYFENLYGTFESTDDGVSHNFDRVRLTATYDKDTNILNYKMVPLDTQWDVLPGSYEANMTTSLNDYGNSWRVMLGGSIEPGAQLNYGEAYFNDFKVSGSTVTPEPASFLLFGIGSTVLMLWRKKRKIQIQA